MYVEDVQLQLAIRLVGHPRNEVREWVNKDVEALFGNNTDSLKMEDKKINANSKDV